MFPREQSRQSAFLGLVVVVVVVEAAAAEVDVDTLPYREVKCRGKYLV